MWIFSSPRDRCMILFGPTYRLYNAEIRQLNGPDPRRWIGPRARGPEKSNKTSEGPNAPRFSPCARRHKARDLAVGKPSAPCPRFTSAPLLPNTWRRALLCIRRRSARAQKQVPRNLGRESPEPFSSTSDTRSLNLSRTRYSRLSSGLLLPSGILFLGVSPSPPFLALEVR